VTSATRAGVRPLTNCHVHTFTHRHTPARFLPWPVPQIVAVPVVRRGLGWLARLLDPKRQTRFGRYVQIVETTYRRSQQDIFEIARGFYPEQTRFVVLPLDMTFLNAGPLELGIDEQHQELAVLRDTYRSAVVPFAGVDPRHEDIVEKTIRLVEEHGFRGLKLYPPTGFHPFDQRLWPLYEYAEQHGVPVLSHCNWPASVQYRGEPTIEMRTDPVTGEVIDLDRENLLIRFTDPDSCLPVLERFPGLRFCIAHFGGPAEWRKYLDHPWDTETDPAQRSWLSKILDMIRSQRFPNLWTDVSFTLYSDDEYVYLLKVLLSEEAVSSRVLFGSDFYVVEAAPLEERRRSARLRAVVGEELFDRIARENPSRYLGDVAS
jgi:predicted TIM-barrel fold metal-dependent hydrolase